MKKKISEYDSLCSNGGYNGCWMWKRSKKKAAAATMTRWQMQRQKFPMRL